MDGAGVSNIDADGGEQHAAETTGVPPENAPPVRVTGGISSRPMSLTWITDDLLRYTQEVWSKAYGRTVSEDEALEMLVNIRRLAEVMLRGAERKGVGG